MRPELEEKLLNCTLPRVDEHEMSLPSFLRTLLEGEMSFRAVRIELYKALRQAAYKPITLGEFIQATRDELQDPLYQRITCVIDELLQSEELSHLHGKTMKSGVVRTDHLDIALAEMSLKEQCEEHLTDEEKEELTAEARASGKATWEERVEDFVSEKLRK